MIPLEEARRRILEAVQPLQTERVATPEAEGRVLRRDLIAPSSLPAFDTSAVDGYAVLSEDIRPASLESPVYLPVISRLAAGDAAVTPMRPRASQRIFTGAELPSGADSVVMQEDTVLDSERPDWVGVTCPAQPWENVRLRGGDIRAGTRVAEAGTRVTFGQIALFSALGISFVEAGKSPGLTLLATGSELREPGEPLPPGKIYESNRSFLACMARGAGANPALARVTEDRLDPLCEALEEAFTRSDAVATIGGVSVGDHDLIRPAFTKLGGEILFWKIAARPGKPFVFGRLNGKFLFGLPGNPVSAAVSFWLLVRPALLALQGASNPAPAAIPAVLGETLANRGDRSHFLRVRRKPDGRLYSAGPQAAHSLSSLAVSDGLVEVPPGQTFPEGMTVSFMAWSSP